MSEQEKKIGMDTVGESSGSWEYAQPPYANPAPGFENSRPGQPPVYPEYGPLGAPPKEKPKKEHAAGRGLRIFAIIMSALFVLSLVGWILSMVLWRGAPKTPGTSQEGQPGIDIEDIPRGEDTPSAGGILSNNAVYETVEPSVVGVVCYAKTITGTKTSGQGSGIIFDENGYIVTNNHVVSNPEIVRIDVILSNGESYEASLIGGDGESDIAVLKIDASGLRAATFGNSDQIKVGDHVFVIGNPSGIALAGSMTDGIVSATNRQVQVSDLSNRTLEFIQTNAAINPGNSGGALANEYGQVVGISSAKLVAEDYEGICFAIPINNAKTIVESIIQNGYVTGRVKIGITYTAISEALAQLNGIPVGLRVVTVQQGSDALKRGLEPGDIITHIDDTAVYDAETIASALDGKKPGDTIKLTVYRVDAQGKALTLRLPVRLLEKTAND